LSALFSRAGAEVAALAMVAISAVLVVRTIGPSAGGELAIGTTVFYLLTVLVNGGLQSAGAQEAASNPHRAARLVRQIAKLRLTYAVVALVAAEVLVALLPLGVFLRAILAGSSAGVLVQVLRHEWLLVATGSVLAVSATRVAAAVATLAVAALIVGGATTAPYLVLFILAGPTTAAILSTVLAWGRVRSHASHASASHDGGNVVLDISDGPDLDRLRALAVLGSHYARADLSIFVYNNSDRLFLYAFGGAVVVGLYDAAYKLIQPFASIATVVGDTMFLRLARAFDGGDLGAVYRRYLDLMLLATVPVGFLLAAVGPGMIALVYGERFAGAGPLVALLGWVVTFGYLSGVLAIPFSAWRAPRAYGRAITAGSIGNLVLNFLLIPTLSAAGAAVATIGAKLVVVAAATRPFRSMSDYPVFRDFGRYCVAAAVGFVSARLAIGAGLGLVPAIGLFGLSYLLSLAVLLIARPRVNNDKRVLERRRPLEVPKTDDVPGGEEQP
jgi:O-antigen/teichoic acid export membrane protein